MLFPEHELYLLNIKKVIRNNIFQTTNLYNIILKNPLQKALDTIIGENQSAAITKINQYRDD